MAFQWVAVRAPQASWAWRQNAFTRSLFLGVLAPADDLYLAPALHSKQRGARDKVASLTRPDLRPCRRLDLARELGHGHAARPFLFLSGRPAGRLAAVKVGPPPSWSVARWSSSGDCWARDGGAQIDTHSSDGHTHHFSTIVRTRGYKLRNVVMTFRVRAVASRRRRRLVPITAAPHCPVVGQWRGQGRGRPVNSLKARALSRCLSGVSSCCCCCC